MNQSMKGLVLSWGFLVLAWGFFSGGPKFWLLTPVGATARALKLGGLLLTWRQVFEFIHFQRGCPEP